MGKNLKIRESLYILKGDNDTFIVVFTGIRIIRSFRFDSLARHILNILCKGEVMEDDLIVNAHDCGFEEGKIRKCINAFKAHGIIYETGKFSFNEEYKKRFSRQLLFLNELTASEEELVKMQTSIKDATITVFGVGGIGSWIVNGLCQIGVGKIRIVDPDVVEESNLNRQLLFTSKDIGNPKVDVIKEKLPDANIETFKETVCEGSDLMPIIKGSTLVVNCADSPSVQETTRIIAGYCEKLKIPYSVAGGYNMHLGMLGPIIIPGETACFNCFLEHQKENDPLSNFEKIKDIEQTGSIAPVAGMVANFHVMEIFKYLIGKGTLNLNRFAELNFMDFSIEWRHFSKNPVCLVCSVK